MAAQIDLFSEQANGSGLDRKEVESLVGGLRNLKRESVRSACRRYVQRELGRSAWREFDELYGLRSTISHGGDVPAGTDLGVEVGKLDAIVSALLQGLGRSQSAIEEDSAPQAPSM